MDIKGSVLMQRYEVGRLLGQGTFGKVYYARSLSTTQSVAIKIINKDKVMKIGLIEQIKREISIMGLVRHPNIIHLYEVMATKSTIYFVLEYAKGGELFDKVAKGKLKEELARKFFLQLINAVDFCHSRGVYHRDLKPENLLLDENENLKVSDFGLSALAESRREDGLLHTMCGTPAYVAPEVIKRKGYDGAKADTWSCGVVLYVLLAGYLPFQDSNLMEMYRKIGKAEFKCPSSFPPEARQLLNKILDPNPNTRITLAKIKEHTWVQKESSSKHLKTQDNDNRPINANVNPERDNIQPMHLNAFDIISLSDGFNLSGLFEDRCRYREVRFTCKNPAQGIISKFEEIGHQIGLKVSKKDAEGGVLRLEGSREGKKGILGIEVEFFEVELDFHLLEVKKCRGDTLEYEKVLKEDIWPCLKDIVWHCKSEQQENQARPGLSQQ